MIILNGTDIHINEEVNVFFVIFKTFFSVSVKSKHPVNYIIVIVKISAAVLIYQINFLAVRAYINHRPAVYKSRNTFTCKLVRNNAHFLHMRIRTYQFI